MGTVHYLKILAACCMLAVLAACGGGSGQSGDLSADSMLDTGSGQAALDLSSYEPDAAAGLPALPQDDSATRSSSAWDISQLTVLGSEFILQEGSLVEGSDLLIGAGDGSVQTDDGSYAYGMYQLSCEPGTKPLALNIECTPEALNKPYFVAVANYTDMRWKWFGPVNLPEFQLDLAGHNKQFNTVLGNLYFLILSPNGSVATHSQTTLTCGAPTGDEPPGCPHNLVASDGQVPDAVAIDWVPGAGNGSFEVFRRNPAPDSEWLKIGETMQAHFLDTHAPDWKMFFYRVRAVNANGESCFSNVDSGFAGGGAEPGIITGQITNIVGEPLPGIAVGLLGFDEQMVRITNQEGKFLFRDLPKGDYVVVPMNPDLKFFPPAHFADLVNNTHVDMHFNAAPEALFHRIHGFTVVLTPPDSQGPPALPLKNVTLRLNPIGDPEHFIETRSDECGHYSFQDVPNGTYMLRAFLPGMEFVPDVHEVVVNGSNPPDRRDFFGHPDGSGPPQP